MYVYETLPHVYQSGQDTNITCSRPNANDREALKMKNEQDITIEYPKLKNVPSFEVQPRVQVEKSTKLLRFL